MRILFLILFLFLSSIAHADITTGLVGWWKFDDGSGSTATDSSGNGNDLNLVNGVTWSTGKIGPFAETLNGSSQFAVLPTADFGSYPTSGSTNTYDLSFSSWFKTNSDGVILGQDNNAVPPSTPTGYVPAIYVDTNGNIRASMFWHNSINNQIVSGSTFNDGNWHQVVDTYTSGVESLYIDGIFINSQSQSQISYSSVYSYFLGTGYVTTWPNTPSGFFYFNGSIDDARIYNRALTAGDVAELYAYPPSSVITNTYIGKARINNMRIK